MATTTKSSKGSWFQRLTASMTGTSAADPAVVRELERARKDRERIRIGLGSRHAEETDDRALPVTTIEQIREQDIVVAQPTYSGRVMPIATYETVRLVMMTPGGRVMMESKCQGRFKMQAGAGNKTFYGYRLDMPSRMQTDDRRLYQRVLVGFDLAPEAKLRTLKSPVPIVGTLADISEKGAKLRCRNADSGIEANHTAYLHVVLPEPVGAVDALVMVRGVSEPGKDGTRTVSFTFEKKIEALEEFIRSVDRKRAARRR